MRKKECEAPGNLTEMNSAVLSESVSRLSEACSKESLISSAQRTQYTLIKEYIP